MSKIHTFTYKYEIDATLGEAVAAYLDAEHYSFLHEKYLPEYEIQNCGNLKTKITQRWRLGMLTFGQSCICEYRPPACFLNYDIKPVSKFTPSIHRFIKTVTELNYYENKETNHLVSDLKVTMEMPLLLFPFRKLIERKLKKLKWEKDLEDMAMISRRQKLFGRDNLKPYFAKHQFMLYKDEFCKHFG